MKNIKYYIGIDIGGTNIKTGVINENGAIISEHSIPTGAQRQQNEVLNDIILSVKASINGANVNPEDIAGAGMGTPGMIDVEKASSYTTIIWAGVILPSRQK